ncbi:MAG: hypothetical protein P8175_00020 [Deltaproteobacteria bacterium]
MEDLYGLAIAGQISAGLSLGAQVIVINDNSTQTAFIGLPVVDEANSATIDRAGGTVTVEAKADRTIEAEPYGGGISLGGSIGASVAIVNVGGHTKAYIDDAHIGQGSEWVGAVSVIAESVADVEAYCLAVSGGIFFGISGSIAIADYSPTIEASIIDDADITVANDVTIESHSRADVETDALGVNVGGLAALGASVAISTNEPTINTFIANAAVIATTGSIALRSIHNYDKTGTSRLDQGADANATTGSGSLLLGAAGAYAEAETSAIVDTHIGIGATLFAGGDVSLVSLVNNDAEGKTTGIGGGLVGIGVSLAYATASGSTLTYVDDADVTAGHDLEVTTSTYQDAWAKSLAVAGGILSGAGNVSEATIKPFVSAQIRSGATVNAANEVIVTASTEVTGETDTEGVSAGLLAVGVSEAESTVSSLVTAYVGGANTIIKAGSLSVTAAQSYPTGDYSAKSSATGSSGALVAVNATESTAKTTGVVTSFVADNTVLSISDSIEISAVGDSNQRAEADSNNYGLVAAGGNEADAVSNVQTNAHLGNGVTIGAGDSIGGLTDGGLYYVVVDKDNPNKVKLATSFQNALNKDAENYPDPITVDLGHPAIVRPGHSLRPYSRSSAEGIEFDPLTALDADNDTIDLGPGHDLYTGQTVIYTKGAGPAVTISASGDDYNFARSEAGSGGLVAGSAAEANVTALSTTRAYTADDTDPNDSIQTRLEVSSLTIRADHTAHFDSRTNTLQASAVGFSGSWATNIVGSTVEAEIGRNADITTKDLFVDAINTSRKNLVGPDEYNVEAGSGGVLQGNASESETDIANITHATVGADATITVIGNPFLPGEFRVSAFNDVEGYDDVRLDSGGLIVGSGATSAIRADTNDAIVTIEDGVTITSVGDVDLETRTRGILRVEPQVHTYGLASAAVVDGLARMWSKNEVNVGNSVLIDALGTINLLAGRNSDGTLSYYDIFSHGDELNASVIPISDLGSHGEIKRDHIITVGTMPDSGTELRSARDVNLLAELYHNAEITAYGSGKNWMTALAGGIDSMFGSDGISEEMIGGTATNEKNASVTVNGTIEVGTLKNQELVVDSAVDEQNQNLFIYASTQTGGITFTQSTESLASQLKDEYEYWQDLLYEYSDGDPDHWTPEETAYSLEIQRVEQEMKDLGLWNDHGTADTRDDEPITSYAVPYVTVNNIWAQAGTINVMGQDLLGSGSLNAPGNVTVSITNNSPAYLRVNKITIPDHVGGRVNFNGVDVESNEDIAELNEHKATFDSSVVDESNDWINIETGGFATGDAVIYRNAGDGDAIGGLVDGTTYYVIVLGPDRMQLAETKTDAEAGTPVNITLSGEPSSHRLTAIPVFSTFETATGTSEAPEITITNTFDADAPHPYGEDVRTSEVEIVGDINNILGLVEITSVGSIMVQASINAGDLHIDSEKGNFVMSYTDSMFHVGGNPGGLEGYGWDNVARSYENYTEGNTTITTYHYSGNAASNTSINNALYNSPPGENIITGMNVFISAKYLNINGTIQSGMPERQVTIARSEENAINGAEEAANWWRFGYKGYAELWVNMYGLSTQDYRYFKLPADADDNIDVYYDAELDRLELEPVQVEGGNMQLYGQILSTGYGKLRVLDGYGQIKIENRTKYDLVTKTLDTGHGVQGRLKIIDTAFTDLATGMPRVREYWRENGQVQMKEYFLTPPDEDPVILFEGQDGGDRTTTYSPLDGWRYYWNTGRNFTEQTITTYGSSSWLDIDALAADPKNIVDGPHRTSMEPRALREGEYFAYEPSVTDDYTYDFTRYLGMLVESINVNSDTITFTTAHNIKENAQAVVYRKDTGGDIGGLKSNTTYFVILVPNSPNTIKLAKTKSEALGGTAINLTGSLTGTHRFGITRRELIRQWETSTWYGTTTYYKKVGEYTPQKDVHSHSIRADRDIDIEFIGWDAGDPNVQASVATNNSNLLVDGAVRNAVGSTTLTAGKEIKLINDEAVIGGRDITLNGGTGIGKDKTLRTNLNGGVLNAQTSPGDIRVEEISGELKVGHVDAFGDVELTAQYDIVAEDSSSLVRGGKVTLTSKYGDIGTLGTDGTASEPASDALPLRVDTGETGRDVLLAKASGEVYLSEVDGALRLEGVETYGDVRIEVLNGDLEDGNLNEARDTRTIQQLEQMWDRMWATEATADNSINATISAYENVKTRDYHAYWRYRNRQTDDSVSGLTNGVTYYVVVDSDDASRIKLAATSADATAAEPVVLDLTASTETGAEHRLYALGTWSPILFASSEYSSGGAVDSDADTIFLGPHSLTTGDAVTYYRVVPYDSTFQVTLSDAERDYYTEYYSNQGLDPETAIATLENKRTTEYHTLHRTYGDVGNSSMISDLNDHDADIYDSTWSYDDEDPNLHRTFGGSEIADSTIDLSVHVFTNGQAVMYRSGGGSITGLEDGKIYYVVLDDADPGKIGLAATQADATAPTPKTITFTHENGDSHYFSDGEVLKQRAAWSENQLKNSVSATITRPKTVSGTTITKEAPNIKGSNIALKVSGNVGVATGQFEITLPLSSLSPEQKTALAAAERDDVTFYADEAGTIRISPDGLYVAGVDAGDNKILFDRSHGFYNGQAVIYTNGGNPSIGIEGGGSLVDGQTYYVISSGLASNEIRLATTQGGPAIDLASGLTGDTQIIFPKVAKLRIELVEDVDVETDGVVTASGGSDVNLGSEGIIRIDQVLAGEPGEMDGKVRLKVQEALTNDRTDDLDPVNIRSGDLILEAEEESIGSASAALLLDLASGASLIARANHDIYLRGYQCDLSIQEVFANDFVDLRADGSILDALDDDSTTAAWNINAHSVYLEAGTGADTEGSIGSATNYLEVDLHGSALPAFADQDIYLHDIAGDMYVDEVISFYGSVGLKAAASILDIDEGIPGNPLVDVYGNNITLVAEYGTIGASGDDLDIDSSFYDPGTLTSSSEFNTYLIEPLGDLSLYTVQTNAGTAFIAAPAGRILNGNPGGHNVISGKTYLFAAQDIGEVGNPITTEVGNIEGKSTAGSTWVTNTGPLTVGGVVDSSDPGMLGGGSAIITATSPITVEEDLVFPNEIILTAGDSPDAGDDLVVVSGKRVQSEYVELRAGDNLIIEEDAVIEATALKLFGDYGNADPEVGSTIDPRGEIIATSVEILGEADGDVFALGNLSAPASVTGGGGTDELIGPDEPGGPDGLINSWEILGPNSGNLNEMFIIFSEVESLTGGSGDDTFYFRGPGSVDGVVDGGAGFDILDFLQSDYIQQAAQDFIDVDLPIGDPPPVPFAATGGIVRIEDIKVILLAELQEDGTLVLNMGPRAAERLTINTEDGDEVFTLGHVKGDPADAEGETIAVSAFGFTLEYDGVSSIRGSGGEGNDTIFLSSDIMAPAELDGGPGSDTLTGGAGNDILLGDAGIITRSYNDDETLRKDVLLTDVGMITGAYTPSDLGWKDVSSAVVSDLLEADLVLLTGAYNGDGSKHFVENSWGCLEWETQLLLVLLLEDGDDILDGGAGDDALFGGRGNDSIGGGDGRDYLVGNAGNDDLDGGDENDILVGDDVTRIVPDSPLPNVLRGLHMTGGNGHGGGIVLGDSGTTIVPIVSVLPNKDLDPLVGVTTHVSSDLPILPDDNVLDRADGTYLVPLASIVTDVGHHLDLLPGNDRLFGGEGDDKLVGDNAVVFSPGVTINQAFLESAFGMTWDLLAALDDFGDLIHRLHDAVGDGDNCHPCYSYEDVVVDQTFCLGNDFLDGGGGNDFMVGDELTLKAPSIGVPTDLVHDFHHLINDLEDVGDEADWALHELDDVAHDLRDDVIPVKHGKKRIKGHLVHHIDRIFVGNDSLVGGDGDDLMVGDNWSYLAPEITVTSGGWPGYHGFWHHDHGWGYDRGNHYGWYNGGHNKDGHDGPGDVWIVGKDTMDGGGGNDVMFGDSIALTEPTMASTADLCWWKFGAVHHKVEDILDDIVKMGQYGDVSESCNAVNGGNDYIVGGDGDDMLFGQGGNDKLYGDAGKDLLVGGYGKDKLVGGPGKDKLIQGVSRYEDSKGHKHKGCYETKCAPCAAWVRHFVGHLGSDGSHDPNSDIQVVLPGRDHGKADKAKGSKK